MARALIGPTGYGSYGIAWRDFPFMGRRGGYSGPYRDFKEAKAAALDWGKALDEPVEVEEIPTLKGIALEKVD